jgi:hypothetical protein
VEGNAGMVESDDEETYNVSRFEKYSTPVKS